MPLSSAEESFLGHIRDNPDDDTTRLVYADWLEEHGVKPERTELIRLQCLPNQEDPAVRERVLELCRGERDRLRKITYINRPRFEKGFLTAMRQSHTDMSKIDNIFDQAPLLDEWDMGMGVPNDLLKAVARRPWLSRIRSLSFMSAYKQFPGQSVDEGLETMLHSPHLIALHRLSMFRSAITSAAFRTLASTPAAKSLRHLNAGCNQACDEGLEAVLSSPIRLRSLDLNGNGITDAGVRLLTEGNASEQLESLTLSSNNIGQVGLHALSQSRSLQQLSYLDLGWPYQNIEPDVIQALFDNPLMPHLENVTINIPEQQLPLLARTPGIGKLRRLRLNSVYAISPELRELDASPFLSPDCKIITYIGENVRQQLSPRFRDSASVIGSYDEYLEEILLGPEED